MKKNYFYIILICLTLINLTVFFINTKENDSTPKYNELTNRCMNELSLIKFNMANSLSSEGLKIYKNLQIVNLQGDSMSIFDLFKKKPKTKLFFRFTDITCTSCIKNILQRVKNLNKQGVDVVVFANFQHFRKFYQFYYDNDLPTSYYYIKNNNLGLPIDDLSLPYLFLLDSTLLTQFMFIPATEFPEITENYFNNIKNRLKNLKN